jgi:hypothetical protein
MQKDEPSKVRAAKTTQETITQVIKAQNPPKHELGGGRAKPGKAFLSINHLILDSPFPSSKQAKNALGRTDFCTLRLGGLRSIWVERGKSYDISV